jgi:hypothetical protein
MLAVNTGVECCINFCTRASGTFAGASRVPNVVRRACQSTTRPSTSTGIPALQVHPDHVGGVLHRDRPHGDDTIYFGGVADSFEDAERQTREIVNGAGRRTRHVRRIGQVVLCSWMKAKIAAGRWRTRPWLF